MCVIIVCCTFKFLIRVRKMYLKVVNVCRITVFWSCQHLRKNCTWKLSMLAEKLPMNCQCLWKNCTLKLWLPASYFFIKLYRLPQCFWSSLTSKAISNLLDAESLRRLLNVCCCLKYSDGRIKKKHILSQKSQEKVARKK